MAPAVLRDSVRDRPDDAREAFRSLLELAARAPTESLAGPDLVAARRLSEAWAQAWSDSFLVRILTRFRNWSPEARRDKIIGDSLRAEGNRVFSRSGPGAAMEPWRESLRRLVALGDSAGMAATLGNIGAGWYRQGALDSASVYLERSDALAEDGGDWRTAGNALGNLASVAKDRRDLVRARALYARAIELRARTGDTRGLAADQNNLGLVAQSLGDLAGARRAFADALALNRAHGREGPAATNLTNLANLASLEGEYDRAAEQYHEALRIDREQGMRVDAALVLRALGLLEFRRGAYHVAERALREALAIYQDTKLPEAAVSVERDLAVVAAAMGDLQSAVRELRRAERAATQAPPDAARSAALALAWADLSLHFNRLAEADRRYRQAAELYAQAGDRGGQVAVNRGRAVVLMLRGADASARTLFERVAAAESASGDVRAASLTRILLAAAQADEGDALAARRTLDLALDALGATGDPWGEAQALGALGDLATRTGARVAAESLYRRGLARLGERPAAALAWQLHAGLGSALRSRGALDEAGAELRAAVAAIDRSAGTLASEERRAAYLADKWDVYAELALVERARGNDSAAFAASERLRAREMLDLLARGRVTLAALGDLATREQDLRRRIAELTRQVSAGERAALGARELESPALSTEAAREGLARAQEAYADVLVEARERSPAYATLVTGDIVPWRAVAARLAADQVFIEYLATDSAALAFVVTHDSIATVELKVTRRSLAALVDFARHAISPEATGEQQVWRAPLRRLYDRLVAPIEAAGLLRGKRLLVIAPHVELHYLPFAALLAPADRFLIERYALVTVPSASVWMQLAARAGPQPAPNVLALAPRAAALPGTREEIDAIQRAYGNQATLLVGAGATESALNGVADRYGILHLATFGVLNKRNPLFSFLELGPSAGEDGRLEVHEVFGLRLNARLVVLSACQTGVGAGAFADVPNGDDWVGLVEAFHYAGARNVLATLWSVDDRATAVVMARFYSALRAGHDEATALAEAQRRALIASTTRNPYLWAGFVLSGVPEIARR
jgi:CHAT domain-containing protein/tetratricopeptide (TPR) repeat protein